MQVTEVRWVMQVTGKVGNVGNRGKVGNAGNRSKVGNAGNR